MTTFAIIVAAGSGKRFTSDIPKQYCKLSNGKTVLQTCIEKFVHHDHIDNVLVVISSNHKDLYSDSIKDIESKKLLPYVLGGKERYDSVHLALASLQNSKPDIVLVHDAVRPFVSEKLIDRVIVSVKNKGNAIPYIDIDSSVKMIDNNKMVNFDRDKLVAVQTPQGFLYDELVSVYTDLDHTITDESAIFVRNNKKVFLIDGEYSNRKITFKEDIKASTQRKHRIGIGYDVHRFEDIEEDYCYVAIGGVKIKHKKKIVAHSDGDVVIHALIDAILGALSLGDIGEIFPDTDQQYKDRDSKFFLQYIYDTFMANNNILINNVDVIIICEEPKISPHKSEIKKVIASILNIDTSVVSIKATNEDKLGFVGRKQGIKADAIISLQI